MSQCTGIDGAGNSYHSKDGHLAHYSDGSRRLCNGKPWIGGQQVPDGPVARQGNRGQKINSVTCYTMCAGRLW